jgi:lipopolysaccharide export system permease protein
MKIVSRYLLREWAKILILVVVVFVLVFFVVDFLERIDNFMEAGVPLSRVGLFFLMFLPSVIFHLAPVAILVATLITLGLMARNSEIVAFKAGGVSLMRLSAPILVAALSVSVLMFIISETVIPFTSARVNSIWEGEVEKQRKESNLIRKNVWFKNSGGVYNFRIYDEGKHSIEGVSVFLFDDKFRLQTRIEATRAWRLGEENWMLYDGIEKTYGDGTEIKVRRFTREKKSLPDLPERFAQVNRSSEEMSAAELTEWINQMENEGYDPLRYVVDLKLKYSFPFICVIMAIIGLPIAFWKEKGGGIALGIGVGIGLSFVYLVFLGLSRSLGYSGALPPIMAAWLPNVLFTVLGVYLFTYVRQ